jgi:glycolate oxidase FAD binding subunit
MRFATLEGKLVQSGGMVVKNVAGLDMAKLMIGSFGTLAAIATVNFKVTPMPAVERTFLLGFETARETTGARDRVLKGVLQPSAIDILSPGAAALCGLAGGRYVLAIEAGGNAAVIARYASELRSLGGDFSSLESEEHTGFWRSVAEFPGRPEGCVVRVSCRLTQLVDVLESTSAPLLARAGSGVCYAAFEETAAAARWMREADARGYKAIMESAPEGDKETLDLWPTPGPAFETMTRVKQMFDPNRLLNRDRLYRRI